MPRVYRDASDEVLDINECLGRSGERAIRNMCVCLCREMMSYLTFSIWAQQRLIDSADCEGFQ